ncbi:hypothetical protein VTN02DRAFT_4301 [Thermoascus thermophilus]
MGKKATMSGLGSISGRALRRGPHPGWKVSHRVRNLQIHPVARNVHHHAKARSTPSSAVPKPATTVSKRSSYLEATKTAPAPAENNPGTSLSMLPLSAVVRSLCVTTVSSSPVLLRPSMALLSLFAHSKSAFLNPDRNWALKYALAKTVYAQFCAGETPAEVKESIQNLKRMGYSGVLLGYAKEVVMAEDETDSVGPPRSLEAEELRRKRNSEEIQSWMDGTMKTVELAEAGDFVSVKFTGAGKQTLEHLLRGLPPSPELEKAMVEICERAKERGVRLLFDAEQQAVQHTIDEWTLDFQRRYNGTFMLGGQPRALVYGTYQSYLLSTPATLARHLAAAQAEGFVLGVKLVRGAYLGSDPRHLICGSKDETDRMYDSIAESLITRKYGEILTPHPPSPTTSAPQEMPPFPQVDLVLASHNRDSVKKAQALRNWQVRTGQPRIEIAYAQLQGMADDISCELVQESKHVVENQVADRDPPRVYKYLVWGTVGQCTEYLLRRGQENKDAVSRTRDTRRAMAAELKRRCTRSWGSTAQR